MKWSCRNVSMLVAAVAAVTAKHMCVQLLSAVLTLFFSFWKITELNKRDEQKRWWSLCKVDSFNGFLTLWRFLDNFDDFFKLFEELESFALQLHDERLR